MQRRQAWEAPSGVAPLPAAAPAAASAGAWGASDRSCAEECTPSCAIASAAKPDAASSSTGMDAAAASPFNSAYTAIFRAQCPAARPPFTAKLPASRSRCQMARTSSSLTSTRGPNASGRSVTWSRTARRKSSRLSWRLRDARTRPRTRARHASGRSRAKASVTEITPWGCTGARVSVSSKPRSLASRSGCCLASTTASSTLTSEQSTSPLSSFSMRWGGGPATTHSTQPSGRPRPRTMSCPRVWLRAPMPSTAQRLPCKSAVDRMRVLFTTRFCAKARAMDASTFRGFPCRRHSTTGTQVP
mmetsp:Transcript_87309/g.271218  ORF Transcript_87309/g.271218 Transcript_87309/m.271218 type:complete len:302 (+) Transcript_87309:25-930(+)